MQFNALVEGYGHMISRYAYFLLDVYLQGFQKLL